MNIRLAQLSFSSHAAFPRRTGVGGAAIFAALLALAACSSGETSSSSNMGGGGSGASSTSVGASGGGGSGGSGGEGCVPTEELCNGVDDNCDDVVDENCDCIEGDKEACYTGDPALEGIGVCQPGERTCNLQGIFGGCVDEGTPSVEVCNGEDDDCDSATDEELGEITCGLGICQVTVAACLNGAEVPCVPGPANPAGETCDGTDDDCDGAVDEGCSCVNGSQQPCYTGSQVTQNVGECQDGMQVCSNGQWGACAGDVTPVAEICDGLDNNCDGTDDDSDPGGGAACNTGQQGVCSVGTIHCTMGSLQCEQQVMAGTELCNGLDDDCNGTPDDGNPGGGAACSTGLLGACASGVMTCVNGGLNCQQTAMATIEQCNGVDDDCDGMTDEGNPEGGGQCNTGMLGVCAAGTNTCTNGAIACQANAQSMVEICDGDDNDCDGMVDEGNPGGGAVCNTGLLGVCVNGTMTCSGGQLGCQQDQASGPETCNNLDDDCDGVVDDGDPGGGNSCSTGLLGICAAGVETCGAGMISCQQLNQATTEICNGLDDNCDGSTDDGNPGGGGNCSTGLLGVCAPGTLNCSGGQLLCQQNQASGPEACNNLDDDCDGVTDDGNPGGGSACSTGLLGVCAGGTETCSNGAITCQQNTMSSTEVCNNIDDNCDGATDEGNPGGGNACSTGLLGVCAAGTENCVNGAVACQQDTASGPEVCNNLDDDCDGATDDGNPGGGSACSTGLDGICAAGTEICSSGTISCEQDQAAQPSEICGNNLDDDCNGFADDGCTCAPGSYDCDGVGTCECTVGNGCCGGSCQTQHDNGYGDNFHDCEPLNTYNLSQALKACAAFTGDPGVCTDYGTACDTDGDMVSESAVVCGDTIGAGECACWTYDGIGAGYTYDDPASNGCLCPLIGDPQWN